jgi:hypothetical protein
MEKEIAINTILGAHDFFIQQSAGYKSWGKVAVLQIATRIDGNAYLINDENSDLSNLNINDCRTILLSDDWIGSIFLKRKKINYILITQQEFATQIKEEIPPILDDQAQLLGVTVRVAKDNNSILKAINNRFAALLQNGKSICIGNTLEDAYVAAQLLEKTSKAFIEAKYLGGAKSINKIEAWVMQQFYQFKYSKEALKNK